MAHKAWWCDFMRYCFTFSRLGWITSIFIDMHGTLILTRAWRTNRTTDQPTDALMFIVESSCRFVVSGKRITWVKVFEGHNESCKIKLEAGQKNLHAVAHCHQPFSISFFYRPRTFGLLSVSSYRRILSNLVLLTSSTVIVSRISRFLKNKFIIE